VWKIPVKGVITTMMHPRILPVTGVVVRERGVMPVKCGQHIAVKSMELVNVHKPGEQNEEDYL